MVLRKRCIIETLFGKLKSTMGLEHSRRRSPVNALVPMLSCLAADTLAEAKVNIASSGPVPIPNISAVPKHLCHLQQRQAVAVCFSCRLAHGGPRPRELTRNPWRHLPQGSCDYRHHLLPSSADAPMPTFSRLS
ncbi:MAG: hypothetical protein TE42_05430 [Candidatus Synechococcus spongiarum SP3]|uniref:Transposase DDE domain-containing protein n=1 Tax=Candidatus Synechococcus spongiarum SP3 TaxID=1604020 RepID=A0A0G2J4V3_9SYNE|nr:MAG: hypothetical protein TE42_05430 [Candidatus Synechococcus spongiarum SP3]